MVNLQECRSFVESRVRRHHLSVDDIDDVYQDVVVALLVARLRSCQEKPPDVALVLTAILAERRCRQLPLSRSMSERMREAETAPSAEDMALAAERVALVHGAIVELGREAPWLALALQRDLEGEVARDATERAAVRTAKGRVMEIARRVAAGG